MIGFRPVPVTHFNLMINGYGLGAKVDDLVPPKLQIKIDELRAGGLDGVIGIDTGIEKLEMEFTLFDYDPFVLTKFGFATGGGPSFNIRGAMKQEGLLAIPLSINVQGMITEMDFGSWKAGDAKKNLKVKVFCHYYSLNIGGVDLIEINVHSGIRKIGGVVQNADVNAALGIIATI